MSEIKAGDLVQVVRSCCDEGGARALGCVFTVASIGTADAECNRCGSSHSKAGGLYAFSTAPYGRYHGCRMAPLPWLRRIPPLDELDDVKHEETIEA